MSEDGSESERFDRGREEMCMQRERERVGRESENEIIERGREGMCMQRGGVQRTR